MEGFSTLSQTNTSFLLKPSYKCALLSLRNAPLLLLLLLLLSSSHK
jgi:hypothetical protein